MTPIVNASSADTQAAEGIEPAQVSEAKVANPFSPWALSWANWLITGLLASVGSVVVALGEGVTGLPSLLVIAVTGEVAAGAVLIMVTRSHRASASSRLILLCFLLTALARSSVVAALLVLTSPLMRADPRWGLSAVVALAIAAVIVQMATAAMLDSFDTCKQRRCQVQNSIAKLSATTDFARESVLKQRRDITTTYETIVIPKLDELVHQLDALDPSMPDPALRELARDCGVNAREHVRNISHRLLEEPTQRPIASRRSVIRSPLGIIRSMSTISPPVLATTVLAVCLRLPGEAINGGSGAWARALLTACWVAGYFMAVGWLRRWVPKGTTWGMFYLATALLLFYLMSIQVLAFSMASFPTRQMPPSVYVDATLLTMEQAAALWLLGAAIATTVIKAAELSSLQASEEQQKVEASLRDAERSLAQEVGRLRGESAYLLHGSVQGRLAMAGVMLRECANETNLELRSEKLTRIRGALEGAKMDLLTSRTRVTSPVSLEERLEDLASKWRGLISMRWHIGTTQGSPLLTAEEPAVAEVIDVIAEGVGNASRHGGASKVDIDIAVGPKDLRVTLSDNGCGLDEMSQKVVTGLGTRLYESLGSYSLRGNSSGGATIDVIFPRH